MAQPLKYRKFKQLDIDKLAATLASLTTINSVRQFLRQHFDRGFRTALAASHPEFFLFYYLGFRLPAHQRRWIALWRTVKYLLELAPRDHGKSWIFNYGLPLQEVYASYVRSGFKSVTARILSLTKTDTQADKFSNQIRETIERNTYLNEDFGDIVDRKYWLKDHFRCKRSLVDAVEKDWTYEKCGILGAITGGHQDRIIGDDCLDDENTKTVDRMDTLSAWFWGTVWNMREVYTRFSFVGTRKNRRDLYSEFLANPVWKANVERAIIKYPMIPDPDKPGAEKQGWRYITSRKRVIDTPPELRLGEEIVDVELLTDDHIVLWPSEPAFDNDGKPELDPDTGLQKVFGWGIKELLLDRAASGPLYFDREKQNNISSTEGVIFDRAWWRFFATEELFFNPTDSCVYLNPSAIGL